MSQERVPKWIKALVADPKKNIHGFTGVQVANRYYNRKWSIEECLSTPLLTPSQSATRAAKKSCWSRWEPGKYSRADKERRG